MLINFKRFLTDFFYTYVIGRPAVRVAPSAHGPVRGTNEGINGQLTVDALLVRDTDRDTLILVVDADLHDIPVWADWDRSQNTIGVAQQNSAYATMTIKIEKEHQDMLKKMNRIMVVTKVADMSVVHHVPFIARED